MLDAEGWSPVLARQQGVRLENRQGFQLHEVRFARRDDLLGTREVGETRPELILQNSHDGTRACRIDAGLYRLVCRNCLVVADTGFAHVSLRHVDVAPGRFVETARVVSEATPRLADCVKRWKSVQMLRPERVEFARRAAALRWEASDTPAQLVRPAQLLIPGRPGDEGHDLWTVFNVVQEKLVQGGLKYFGVLPQVASRAPNRFFRNRVRAVASLTGARQLNKALWTLKDVHAQPVAYFNDEAHTVSRSFGVKVTPQVSIITPKGLLVYTGPFDSTKLSKDSFTAATTEPIQYVNYVAKTVEALRAGSPILSSDMAATSGCEIR